MFPLRARTCAVLLMLMFNKPPSNRAVEISVCQEDDMDAIVLQRWQSLSDGQFLRARTFTRQLLRNTGSEPFNIDVEPETTW